MHLQENILFNIDPKVKGIKVTQNVAQLPRQHVTYSTIPVALGAHSYQSVFHYIGSFIGVCSTLSVALGAPSYQSMIYTTSNFLGIFLLGVFHRPPVALGAHSYQNVFHSKGSIIGVCSTLPVA